MTDLTVSIKCKKCGSTFEPNMKTRIPWRCLSCRTKNPNLKRHYRSVADVCLLGFILTVIVAAVRFKDRGLDLGVLLGGGHAVLLLVTIIRVYKSKAPWKDSAARTLIWTVFGLALVFNVVVPLLLAGMLNIPAIVVYAIVFPYLFWLNSQANRCTVPEPSPFQE